MNVSIATKYICVVDVYSVEVRARVVQQFFFFFLKVQASPQSHVKFFFENDILAHIKKDVCCINVQRTEYQ